MVDSRGRLSRLRDRYSDLVSDRFYAMVASSKFSKTRGKWLREIGRTRPFQSMDDWIERETVWKDEDPGSFRRLELVVGEISRAFALAPWHVLWTLFVRGHRPGTELFKMFPMDVRHPRARLLVSGHDTRLVEGLHVTAAAMGVYVELYPSPEQSPSESEIASLSVLVDLPIEIPPELAYQECRYGLNAGRTILRDFGMPIPHRVRRGGQRSSIACALVVRALDPVFVSVLKRACENTELVMRSDTINEDEGLRSGPLGGIRLEVRFAPTVKSDLLVGVVRNAIKESRAAIQSAGLNLGTRLRPSILAKRSENLKVDGQKLPRRGLGDLAERVLDSFPAELRELTPKGRSVTRALKARRDKVKRRFIKKGLLSQ